MLAQLDEHSRSFLAALAERHLSGSARGIFLTSLTAHKGMPVMNLQEPTNTRTLRGSCQCGAVTYEVADEFTFAVYCHCSICRRATGAAFKPHAGIERAKLRVTRGADNLLIFRASSWHDERCSKCGSFLFAVVRDGTFAHIAMGTLADDPTIRPSAHIFVGSKAPWFTITDDLPQYDEGIVSECILPSPG